MSNFIFITGPAGHNLNVDSEGRLMCNANATTSGFIFGYGETGYPLLVDGAGRLLINPSGIDISGTSGNYYEKDDSLLPDMPNIYDIGSDISRFAIVFAESGNFSNGIQIGSGTMHLHADGTLIGTQQSINIDDIASQSYVQSMSGAINIQDVYNNGEILNLGSKTLLVKHNSTIIPGIIINSHSPTQGIVPLKIVRNNTNASCYGERIYTKGGGLYISSSGTGACIYVNHAANHPGFGSLMIDNYDTTSAPVINIRNYGTGYDIANSGTYAINKSGRIGASSIGSYNGTVGLKFYDNYCTTQTNYQLGNPSAGKRLNTFYGTSGNLDRGLTIFTTNAHDAVLHVKRSNCDGYQPMAWFEQGDLYDPSEAVYISSANNDAATLYVKFTGYNPGGPNGVIHIDNASSGHSIYDDSGAKLTGDGKWSDACDAANKEILKTFPSGDIELLDKLIQLPLHKYQSNFTCFSGLAPTRIGPTAQDVYSIFGVGDSLSVAPGDLAAIGLACNKRLAYGLAKLNKQLQYLTWQPSGTSLPANAPFGFEFYHVESGFYKYGMNGWERMTIKP